MAPPKSRNFSVRVVFPASGWEIMAKVRRGAVLFMQGGKDNQNPSSGNFAVLSQTIHGI
jgi:hypothetical protein